MLPPLYVRTGTLAQRFPRRHFRRYSRFHLNMHLGCGLADDDPSRSVQAVPELLLPGIFPVRVHVRIRTRAQLGRNHRQHGENSIRNDQARDCRLTRIVAPTFTSEPRAFRLLANFTRQTGDERC